MPAVSQSEQHTRTQRPDGFRPRPQLPLADLRELHRHGSTPVGCSWSDGSVTSSPDAVDRLTMGRRLGCTKSAHRQAGSGPALRLCRDRAGLGPTHRQAAKISGSDYQRQSKSDQGFPLVPHQDHARQNPCSGGPTNRPWSSRCLHDETRSLAMVRSCQSSPVPPPTAD